MLSRLYSNNTGGKMKRIYVAGPYSGNTLETLNNMRVGIRTATELLLSGYAPFCPWVDYHYTLALRDGESISYEDYLKYSIAWLEVSDAIYLLPNWEKSKGTLAEIEIAEKLGIPVFYPGEEDVMQEYFELPGTRKPLEEILKEENEEQK
jgi:hypothetical protein